MGKLANAFDEANLARQERTPMLHTYSVEVHNIEKNEWELYAEARTLDEAFEYATKAVGFSKIHDEIEILDRSGLLIWDSMKGRRK